jgi:inositol transport system substrate-binding protein
MKKRVFASFMAMAMAATMLTGCGGDKPAANGSGSGAAAGDDALNMTLIMSLRDEFLSALEAGCKTAADEVGVKLATQDAQNDTSKLLQFVESARNNGDDAVLINLVDAETAQQCIEAAGDMKVVFVNRAPSDTSVLNDNAKFVGSNEMTSGGYQGEFLAKYFNEKGQKDVKYLMLQGTLGLVHTEQRSASVIEQMKAGGLNPIEAAAPLVADYDRANAMDMISPLVDTVEYDCIIANNDAMALGAVEALKAKGMDPTKVPIVGIDATVDGVEAVKNGELAMTVFQDPNGQGYGAVMAAKNMIEGKAITEGTDYETDETGNIVWVPFEPVYPENVADYE